MISRVVSKQTCDDAAVQAKRLWPSALSLPAHTCQLTIAWIVAFAARFADIRRTLETVNCQLGKSNFSSAHAHSL